MQPHKTQILSTRLLDEAATAKSADRNIDIDCASFIEIQAIASDELKNKLQQLAAQPLCVVFTSSNAVSAVAGQTGMAATDWKICCTGGKTKEYAISAFGEDAIIASAKNASGLAERIIALGRVMKVTFFCGDQRLNDLPEKLSRHHIQTDEIIVYTSVLTPVVIEKNYNGILFFSPSAAHSFFSMNTIATEVVLFSIGQTTTAALRSYCTNQVITSDWPGTESLLELVTNFYNTTSRQAEQNIT